MFLPYKLAAQPAISEHKVKRILPQSKGYAHAQLYGPWPMVPCQATGCPDLLIITTKGCPCSPEGLVPFGLGISLAFALIMVTVPCSNLCKGYPSIQSCLPWSSSYAYALLLDVFHHTPASSTYTHTYTGTQSCNS